MFEEFRKDLLQNLKEQKAFPNHAEAQAFYLRILGFALIYIGDCILSLKEKNDRTN